MAHRIVRASAALVAAAVFALPAPASATGGHDHAPPSADPHAGHADHGDHGDHAGHAVHAPSPSEDAHQHGAPAPEEGAGHGHGTEPDAVSPEARNLVLSGFAGVNAAVVFGAWMMRRTGPDPDLRKRTPKAASR